MVGDFDQWDESANCLRRSGEIWEGFIPELPVYTSYKYAVQGTDGKIRYKADPYGFHTETRPATASKLYDIGTFHWSDEKFREDVYKRQLRISSSWLLLISLV